MSKIFKIVGVIVIILSVLTFLSLVGLNPALAFIGSAFSVVLGVAFIALGDLLNRVEYLEEELKISLEGTCASNKELPQKTCPNCSNVHDFDYPKCPNCKYEY